MVAIEKMFNLEWCKLWVFKTLLREGFKNKKKEISGIFHSGPDPPPALVEKNFISSKWSTCCEMESVWYGSANSCQMASQERLEAWGGQLWWNDHRPHQKLKKKVCLKMHFRPFPVFWAYVFLSGKSADPKPSPPLSGKFHYFFLKPSLSLLARD